jgi:hypothetical protein
VVAAVEPEVRPRGLFVRAANVVEGRYVVIKPAVAVVAAAALANPRSTRTAKKLN